MRKTYEILRAIQEYCAQGSCDDCMFDYTPKKGTRACWVSQKFGDKTFPDMWDLKEYVRSRNATPDRCINYSTRDCTPSMCHECLDFKED
jgi:hypothetical protein